MSTISQDEIRRLAQLSRIALTDEEIERFTTELGVIAQAVAQVSEVVQEDTPATSHPIPLTNVWREDDETRTVNREELLDSAPRAEEGQFRVPQILGEE